MTRKVMIVEDESLIAIDLKFMLEDNGYEVVAQASNGETAIELAFLHKPQLILMDIKMPKLDGLKASKIIEQQLGIPVLFISAYSEKELLLYMKQDNILGYVMKPFSEKNVLPVLEVAFHQIDKFNRLNGEILHKQTQLEKRKIIERAKGLLMQAENISEDEAYRKIRNESMQTQQEMVHIAQQIINTLQVNS
ncbi:MULTISPECIES: ANTAR domain-containing response regulator [Lysinibacillus]|jgi:AmiR/NasT family two-component response regulator|uniref:Response regulator n=1 Tax=Lysinibacillus fusiformis TaxID=28031 RepID=A0A2I0V3A2_9BACI|nr:MULTISPECIES: response regulator [Lysinibacillus]KUF29282.1 Fis family transcriptional regulator [Lysinibacillus sp. F5]MEE3808786.1 response regulator [Lysinibacillus fusiformis]PKU52784.1 response regulator [Lysinibacillus fusiformis]WCH49259.1 response regulator [Lysinibacillus sp. OF-1]SCY59928.1 response regulator receiver and ANTAR domain protein [Lysinibacillus sp. SG9]